MVWGFHLALNIGRASSQAIRCATTIEKFSHTLVKEIDMVAYGKPQIVMFGTDDKKGYTLVQLIETSNITAHFVEQTNDIYLDVFSCKKFEPDIVVKVVKDHFNPHIIQKYFFERSIDASNPFISNSHRNIYK